METTPNVKQAVPFFMVADMEKSLDFYVNRLGFELKRKWEPQGRIVWCWLELGTAALMLQEYRPGNVPILKRGEGMSVCFMCEDALAIYRQITEKGVAVAMEPFVGNNYWVVDLRDPDGYAMLFESPTDVPEETTYGQWRQR